MEARVAICGKTLPGHFDPANLCDERSRMCFTEKSYLGIPMHITDNGRNGRDIQTGRWARRPPHREPHKERSRRLGEMIEPVKHAIYPEAISLSIYSVLRSFQVVHVRRDVGVGPASHRPPPSSSTVRTSTREPDPREPDPREPDRREPQIVGRILGLKRRHFYFGSAEMRAPAGSQGASKRLTSTASSRPAAGCIASG